MKTIWFTLFIVLSLCIGACSTSSSGGYGYTSRQFEERGWIRVNQFETGENTAYKRITYEASRNGAAKQLISTEGYPDFYFTADLWDVYYGYLKSGKIYHLDPSYNGELHSENHYSKVSASLPEDVLMAFEGKSKKVERDESRISGADADSTSVSPPPKEEASISYSTGTAFFVTHDGYALTNHHVVEGRTDYGLIIDEKFIPARLVDFDQVNDLALLKIDRATKPFPLNAKKIKKGSDVIAFGFPMIGLQGQEVKTTFGHINALSGVRGDIRYFQVDTPIQPGNSGGPLVDQYGNVVGVITASLSLEATLDSAGVVSQNVNYAIKIGYVLPLLMKYDLQPVMQKVKSLNPVDLIEAVDESVVLVVAM